MARVYPRVDAFRVLQLTEEVENLAALAFFIAGAVVFAVRLEPIQIGVVVFLSIAVFRSIHLFGVFVPPFTLLLPLSHLYSLVSGYGVLLAGLLIFGVLISGWKGVLAFVVARIACGIVFSILELTYGKHVFRETGVAVTASERSFFHAYRVEARRVGASTDLSVSDTELASANWERVFQDLAVKWPVVVNRFTGDDA
jgi:hypothetical protein